MIIEEYKKQQAVLNDSRNSHLKDIAAKLRNISDDLKILGVKDCGNSINNILTKIHNVLNEEAQEVVRELTNPMSNNLFKGQNKEPD